MKIRICAKDPDGIPDSIEEAVQEQVGAIPGLSVKEREAVVEARKEAIQPVISKWVEYGEYVTIEIDTDTGEAIVIPVKS